MKLNPWKIFKRAIIQIDDLAKVHARVYKQTLIMIEMVRQQENSLPDVAVKIRKAIEYGGIKMDKAMLELGVRRKQCARTFGIYLIAFFSRYKKYIY